MPVTQPVGWGISSGTDRYYRVGTDLADLALALDGARDVDNLSEVLGERWDRDRVLGGLGVLENMQVLEVADGAARPPARRGRVRVIPPLTVQVSLIGPALQRILPGKRSGATTPTRRRVRAVVLSAVTIIALGCYAALIPTTADVLAN